MLVSGFVVMGISSFSYRVGRGRDLAVDGRRAPANIEARAVPTSVGELTSSFELSPGETAGLNLELVGVAADQTRCDQETGTRLRKPGNSGSDSSGHDALDHGLRRDPP